MCNAAHFVFSNEINTQQKTAVKKASDHNDVGVHQLCNRPSSWHVYLGYIALYIASSFIVLNMKNAFI